MSSGENTLPANPWQTVVRRFIARVSFSTLLGLGVVTISFVADVVLLSKSLLAALDGVVGSAALILTVNTVSIGVVTYTTRRNKNARPPLWVLPVSFALLAGMLLVLFSRIGLTDDYPNPLLAFVAGAISGAAAGLAYTLSIPGLRQDSLLKQIKHSLYIGGITGIVIALYFFVRRMPPLLTTITLIQHILAAFVFVPVTIAGMLLSFVLGIELGDRTIEREDRAA